MFQAVVLLVAGVVWSLIGLALSSRRNPPGAVCVTGRVLAKRTGLQGSRVTQFVTVDHPIGPGQRRVEEFGLPTLLEGVEVGSDLEVVIDPRHPGWAELASKRVHQRQFGWMMVALGAVLVVMGGTVLLQRLT